MKDNKKCCKTILTMAATFWFAAMVSPRECYAYLDPSAGGWLYQMIFPVIVAISSVWLLLQRSVSNLWSRACNGRFTGRLAGNAKIILSNEVVRTLIMLPAILVGVVLPIEFISEVNGYLGYMWLWEMFPVFGWQWLFFVLVGLVISSVVLLCSAAVAKIFRKSAPAVAGKILLWLSVSLFLLSFLKSAKLWLEGSGVSFAQYIQFNSLVYFITAIICAFWVGKYPESAGGLIRFAKLVAIAGFVITVMAPFVTWVETPAEGLLPVVEIAADNLKRPDIIIVTVDSLPTSHMSLYGYDRATTPYLENFAKNADVYERFYSNSNITNTSVNSMLHGVRPWTHRSLQLPTMPLMTVAREGLVGSLKAAGYQTYAVATNRYAAPYTNRSDQYFDQVAYGQINRLSARAGMILTKFHHIHPLFRQLFIDSSVDEFVDSLLIRVGVYSETNHYDPERPFAAMRKMILNRKLDKPLFSWVHLYPPHSPYATPAPFIGKFDQSDRHRGRYNSSPPWCYEAAADKSFPDEYVGRYDESVAYVDSHIGSFIAWLKAQGIYDDALIVVSSDHGESFTHGYGGHAGPAMHEDLIHIPLIIKEPKQAMGRRIPVLSEQIDLMPTMLEYAGIKTAAKREGVSIKSGTGLEKKNRPIFSMNFQQNYCFGQLITGTVVMIQGEWKYLLYFGDIQYPMMPKLENALYNLRTDPGESINQIAAYPEIASEMTAAIASQLRLHGGAVE